MTRPQGTQPRNGIVLFTSDRGIRPAELAKAAEERGFDTIYVPEHTHIPIRRDALHPTGGKDLPIALLEDAVAVLMAIAVVGGFR